MSKSRLNPIGDKTQTLWTFLTERADGIVAASRLRRAIDRFQEAFKTDRVDFAAEGLLQDTQHTHERAALLHQLHAAGVPLDELRDAVEQDRLALLPVEAVLRQGDGYTLEQMAAESGLDADALARSLSALGLGLPELDSTFHGDALAAAMALKELHDSGVNECGIQEICRISGRCVQSVANGIRDVFGETFIQAGDSERDLGLRYAAAAQRMLPVFEPLLKFTLTMKMLQLVRSDVVSQAERAVGRLPGGHDIAVCFADLVDFTRLGETLSSEELGELVRRFEELVQSSLPAEVRHVKTVGDATMLVSGDPAAVLDATVELIAAADARDDFPQIHAGIALGHAVSRNGDWFGRPVNLASRLADCAPPGHIYATKDMREVTGQPFRDIGTPRLSGIDRDMTVLCLTPQTSSR